MKKWVIGIDEVGRGPLAGPVAVCAVAMPERAYEKSQWPGLTDSKKMTAKAREKWHARAKLLQKEGTVRFALAKRTAAAIDRNGISVCIKACIAECLEKLALPAKEAIVLLDGSLKAPMEYKRQKTIIKGDLKEKIISLASVIAKVERDHVMIALDKKHPRYAWHANKGYGTALHIIAIRKWGLTPLHRKSYCHNNL